jgi:metal-responsive CopG/Arc/MetJ family transcriptional regulator
MGNVRINLSDNLHRNLKRRAIDEGIPMREVLIKALQEYIERYPPLPLTGALDQAAKRAHDKGKVS